MKQGRRLIYLSLETPREGQATYTHVHEIIRGLRQTGWEVELLVTSRGGASSGTGYLIRLLDYVRVQLTLARQLGRCDAVFMRAHFAAAPVSVLAWLRSVPVFQEINGLPADIFATYRWLRWFSPMINGLYRIQMQMAAHVFAVTEGLREWAKQQAGHGHVSLVTNGANTDLFRPDGPLPDIATRYIVFVGGLTAWHGIGTMIAATKQSAWPDDVALIIIGDGIERDRLTGVNLSPRVNWLGRRASAEVAAYLRGAMAALSIAEDLSGHLHTGVAPLKLFEAMASGTPVIVTDLPFQREIVENHDTGIVIPMADPSALADAVAQLAKDPAKSQRLGRNGRAYIERHATWQRRAEEISYVMTEIVDAHTAGLR